MSNRLSPLVSVIIPAYNSGRFISEAIESILEQIYPELEVIVVNDGSTDNTEEIIRKYRNRVRYIYQPNKGLAEARNSGIRAARGKYLQFLDADDLLLPRKIERQVDFLEKFSDFDIVYSDTRYFNDLKKDNLIDLRLPHHSGYILNKLIVSNFIPINSPLFGKRCIEKVGFFKGNGVYLYGVQDWEFLLRLAYAGARFKYMDEILALC